MRHDDGHAVPAATALRGARSARVGEPGAGANGTGSPMLAVRGVERRFGATLGR